MTDRHDFEDRFEARLRAHADRAARPFDAGRLASDAVAAGGARRVGGRLWWRGTGGVSSLRLAFVGVVAMIALAAGTLLVGAALRAPAPPPLPVVVPPAVVADPTVRPTPAVADTNPTPAPTPTPPALSFPDPSLTAVGVGVGPCAAMVQLLDTWAVYEPDPPRKLGPAGQQTNGYILLAAADGSLFAVDGRSAMLKLPTQPPDPIPEIPGYGMPIARGGEFVPSPNGLAIASEEGDLGVAGCGDPVVRFAHGGMLHPFTARAFQTVTDLAWAHDGSALYGILRPTIDGAGKPIVSAPEDIEGSPGTVLRWDVTSRAVTDLGTPCPTCRLSDLAVAPDGRLVVWSAEPKTWVRQLDGTWTDLTSDPAAFVYPKVIGWTPDGLAVVDGYDHIDTMDLDGHIVTTSGRICCHGNGYGGIVSPDGRQVVGSTLSSDFRSREVVIVDLADGSQRTVARMPNPNAAGAKGPADPITVPTVPYGWIVAWAPDGKSLLMVDQGSDGGAQVRSVSLETFQASDPIPVPTNEHPTAVWLPRLP